MHTHTRASTYQFHWKFRKCRSQNWKTELINSERMFLIKKFMFAFEKCIFYTHWCRNTQLLELENSISFIDRFDVESRRVSFQFSHDFATVLFYSESVYLEVSVLVSINLNPFVHFPKLIQFLNTSIGT